MGYPRRGPGRHPARLLRQRPDRRAARRVHLVGAHQDAQTREQPGPVARPSLDRRRLPGRHARHVLAERRALHPGDARCRLAGLCLGNVPRCGPPGAVAHAIYRLHAGRLRLGPPVGRRLDRATRPRRARLDLREAVLLRRHQRVRRPAGAAVGAQPRLYPRLRRQPRRPGVPVEGDALALRHRREVAHPRRERPARERHGRAARPAARSRPDTGSSPSRTTAT